MSTPEKPLNVYVLKLENDKWYVGKTTEDVEKRFQTHKNSYGALWTKLHKPISIENVIENADKFEEDRTTKKYMEKYGISNVRGGSYVQEELTEIQIKSIQREIWGTTDCCMGCGSKDWITKCDKI